jgi:hypothetical protein
MKNNIFENPKIIEEYESANFFKGMAKGTSWHREK